MTIRIASLPEAGLRLLHEGVQAISGEAEFLPPPLEHRKGPLQVLFAENPDLVPAFQEHDTTPLTQPKPPPDGKRQRHLALRRYRGNLGHGCGKGFLTLNPDVRVGE